jgi:polysaccharide export outer membrane protein
MRRTLVACLITLIWIVRIPVLPAQIPDAPKLLTSNVYVIQPSDVLSIFVWKMPDLSTKVTVRPDGRISFPLIQDMKAAGMHPAELKDMIENALKDYVDAPNVTVIIDAIQSYRVYVTGKVARPGALTNEKPINVLQALALAGGLSDYADAVHIAIVRGSGEDSRLFIFNYPEVVKSKNFTQNMLLQSGDVIVVP